MCKSSASSREGGREGGQRETDRGCRPKRRSEEYEGEEEKACERERTDKEREEKGDHSLTQEEVQS